MHNDDSSGSEYWRIYAKYSQTITPYHIYPQIWTTRVVYLLVCLNASEWVANSADPDQTPLSDVWSGSTLYAQACLSDYFLHLRYIILLFSSSFLHTIYTSK